MPWWKTSSNLSPGFFSDSSSSSPHQIDTMTSADAAHQHPKLTRQRKLRHLSDDEIRELAAGPADEGRRRHSTPVSRSSSNLDKGVLSNARSSSSAMLLPQPLPRPDSASTSPRREPQAVRPLPSPLPSPRDEGNGVPEEPLSMPEPTGDSRLSSISEVGWQAEKHKSPERSSASNARSNAGGRKNWFQDVSANDMPNFRLNVPNRSAPSGFSNHPMVCPARLCTPDFILSKHSPQNWSAPEFPSHEFTPAFSSQITAEKVLASPGRSQLYSPPAKSPERRTRNPSAPSSPLHPKIIPEKISAWHDNNGNLNVHPLPLPPAAAGSVRFPSPILSPKLETSSMTNQWQKGKLIGSGTFGNVYRATNRHTGALCAMKEVNLIPDDPKSAECIKQLQQEINLLTQLKHQNIVQYLGSEIIEDRFYIYLEYVYPGSINKYINEHCGAITESIVRSFTRHILRGLAYLHNTNTMHRDIKGANLLVNSCGVVKLADFGMAKHLSGTRDVLSMKGTPYWMAPEVLQATMNKELSYDLAVDIWSLGCTVIEMFTGKHPWSGFESAAALFKVLHESPQIPEALSYEGKDFLQCCFRRNPAERPTASKLLEHPFITNSQHNNLNGPMQAFAGNGFADTPPSPGCRLTSNGDYSSMKGKHPFNGYSGT